MSPDRCTKVGAGAFALPSGAVSMTVMEILFGEGDMRPDACRPEIGPPPERAVPEPLDPAGRRYGDLTPVTAAGCLERSPPAR
ncbi:hypothetical protein Pve01_46000 [Planomonospora venezuelensis]|nr:hypothetical protein Pve01_46000 [Planomonospora venezuelensis]